MQSQHSVRYALGCLALGSALAALLMPVASVAQKSEKPAAKALPSFEVDVAPVIDKYCASCHSSASPPGGIKLTKGMTGASALKNLAAWQRIAKNVANKSMPPAGMPSPTSNERARLIAWIDSVSTKDCKLADPGKVTIRRLNREEYNNTIRDLMLVDLRPADDFPSDDVGHGFDNIGDVLSMSSLLMENYLKASEKVVKAAIRTNPTRTEQIDLAQLKLSGGAALQAEAITMYANSTASGKFTVKTNGWYRIRVRASATQGGDEFPKLEVKMGRDPLATMDVKTEAGRQENYEVPIRIPPDTYNLSLSFVNDFYRPAASGKPAQDRNLFIHSVEIIGPILESKPTSNFQRKWIPSVPAKPEWQSEGRKLLTNFATKAYRRPVTGPEIDRLMTVFNLGIRATDDYEQAVGYACQAVLCSPNFLYRVELDAAPAGGKTRALNAYELASRMSYFLWSSTPDDTLLRLASTGELLRPEIANQQIDRMIADPKAAALTENFAMQWLQLRKLETFEPDKKSFPEFNDSLRGAMLEETRRTFDLVLRENRPISEFIDSKYTFVNGTLAKLYGIPGVSGDEFVKVSTEGTIRGGLLTQASVLTANSNPTRTSPTKRGRWILEQVLGTPPPPPPPGAGDLSEDKRITKGMTLRQMMEEHRKNPTCAACHTKMDALGFGLENFDPIGRYRTKDGAAIIDPSATLPDGQAFKGAAELKTILMKQRKEFARSLTEKLLTFAIGRGTTLQDDCAIDEIVKASASSDYRIHSLIKGIVASNPFRLRAQ